MITMQVKGVVVKSMGCNCYIPVDTTWRYDEEADPLAIHILLQPEGEEARDWTISRELVQRGMVAEEPVGEGDAKFRRRGIMLLMCLKNETGHADIKFLITPVQNFLNETLEAVQPGSESVTDDLDAVLEEILKAET